MAEYIAVSDIKHRHIRRFPIAELTEYVATTNAWFDSYAQSIGIEELTDIILPVKPLVKSFILSYMYMEFARDSIGAEGTPTLAENNLYESIYAHAKDNYKLNKARVTVLLLKQTAVTREDHAVNWGTMVRG